MAARFLASRGGWFAAAVLAILLTFLLTGGAVATAQEKPHATGNNVRAEPADPDSAEKAIWRKLQQVIPLDFKDATLAEVAEEIRIRAKLPVILDRKGLADAGVDEGARITRKIDHLKLQAALRLLLGELDLTWSIENEALVIGTKEWANTRLVDKVYDLSAVIDEPSDAKRLVEIIHVTVAPSTWRDAGGPGSLSALGNALVVVNTKEVHEQIAHLLAILTKVRTQQETAEGDARFEMQFLSSTAEIAIHKALSQKVTFDFQGRQLVKVVEDLKEMLKFEIQLDRKALQDAGIDAKLQIKFKASGVSAKSALKRMLSEFDLEWVIENDALIITTKEAACRKLVTYCYPLADLGQNVGYDKVTDTIERAISPSTWHAAGGPASIEIYKPCRCLVISNDPDVHKQIEDLLQRLRRTVKDPQPKDPRVDDQGLMLRVYVAEPVGPGGEAVPNVDLVVFVKEFVAPDSWEGSGGPGMIRGAGPALVIRQTPKVHQEVEAFLKDFHVAPLK